MAINQLSIKAIQTFEVAARCESFLLAAEELFVTPAAISYQIKLLEDKVGIQLFHRGHRAVTLTAAGRRYAEEISTAFRQIETATRELSGAITSDIITVSAPPSFAAKWLMPRLARFTKEHPDIDVKLNSSFPVTENKAEVFDIDIRYGGRQQSIQGRIAFPLPPETIVPLCSPALATGERPIREPKDLLTHSLIHSDNCLVKWGDWMRQYEGLNLDLSRGYRFSRSFMAIGSAVASLGVCLDSLLIVQRELEDGSLVAPLGTEGIKINGYSFNVLKSRMDLPKIKCFHEWMFKELENHTITLN